MEWNELKVSGYERVIEAIDEDSGLHAFIAIHNTSLGPSLGGTRIYPYATREAALEDVLKLSKAMTYKSAIVKDGLGGGKGVIIADPNEEKTEKLLLAYAKVVDRLQGKYIAAEDIGTTTSDMAVIRKGTKYVAALMTPTSSGDPSRFTAYGVMRGMRAVAKTLWKSSDLKGKTVAIQGLGNVGAKLARLLFWRGVNLIICDVDPEQTKRLAELYGAEIAPTENFEATPCDIFAPCALGGILNATTIPKLQCQAIAGAANNQLSDDEAGVLLQKRDILYAPDYVINSGGIINAAREFEPVGYSPKEARDQVYHISDTLEEIFTHSKEKNLPTSEIANHLAKENLKNEVGKRTTPLHFH